MPNKKIYPENEKLAQDFKRVYIKEQHDPTTVYRTAKVIQESRTNIPRFYERRKSLEKLNVPGIGPIRKTDIAFILKHGVDEALHILGGGDKAPKYQFEMKLRDVGARKKPNSY